VSGASLGEAVLELSADSSPLNRALAQAQSQTQSWLSQMTSVAAGILTAGLFGRVADGILSVGQAAIGNNAYFQSMAAALSASFSDAAVKASEGGAKIADSGAGAAASAQRQIRDVNERIQDEMADHAQRVADIQAQILETAGAGIAERQAQLGEALANLAESHAERIASIQQQIADANERFAESAADRAESFQERMTDLAETHAERRRALEQQLEDLATSFDEQQAERKASLQERLTDLQETHEERRASIVEQMTEVSDEATVQALLRGELTKEQIAAAGLTKLAERLAKEDAAYEKQVAKAEQRAAKEEQKAQAQHDRQLKALQDRIAKEDASYEKQVAKAEQRYDRENERAQRSHDRQLAALQRRIDQENAAYDRQRAKLEADAAKDIEKLKADNAKRIAELEKQLAKENAMHERRLRDLNQSLEAASQAGAAAVARPVQKAYSELGQMLEKGGFFEGVEEGQARVDKMMDWVRKQALDLPGSVRDAMQATLTFASFNLDPTKWLKPAAGAAATFGRSVNEVAQALGALAAGRGGEAVEMLRSLGVNLRNVQGLEFDAQGQLVTPLEKAMPIVRDFLVNRYGEALAKAQGTWANVTSNLGDLWDAFVTRMGGPLFVKLNTTLKNAMAWLQDPKNEARIDALADAIGNTLSGAFDTLMSVLAWLWQNRDQLAGIWTQVQTTAGELATTFTSQVVPAIRDQVIPAVERIANFVRDNWPTISAVVGAVAAAFVGLTVVGPAIAGVVAAIQGIGLALSIVFSGPIMTTIPFIIGLLGGPLVVAVGAVAAAAFLLYTAWTNNWLGIRDAVAAAWGFVQPVLGAVYAELSRFWTEVQPMLAMAWGAIQTRVGEVWSFIWNQILQPGITTFVTFWQANWGTVQAILEGVWNVISGVVELAWALVSGIILTGLAIISGDWQGAWLIIQEMMQKVWDAMVKIVDGAIAVIEGILTLAWAAILAGILLAWEGGGEEKGKGGIKGAFVRIWDAIKGIFESAIGIDDKSGIRGFLSTAWNAIRDTVESVWGKDERSGIRGVFTTAWEGIVNTVKSLIGVDADGGLRGWLARTWAALAKAAVGWGEGFMRGIKQGMGAIPLPQVRANVWVSVETPETEIGGVKVKAPPIPVPHLDLGVDWKSLADLFPDAFKLAEGTDWWPGGVALLGELGPELAMLPRGSQVLSAAETRNALAGGLDYDRLGEAVAQAMAAHPTFVINPSYRYQDERDLRDDIRLLQLLGASV